MKIGTLFSGIGGVDCGAKNAGLDLAWGIELDSEIASIANQNLGEHVIAADIMDVDPHTLPYVDVLHASPPCTRISTSNSSASESQLDIDLASKVSHFLAVLKPKIFTLENVRGYKGSKSWKIISAELTRQGYWVSVENCNAADFGVPQDRHRMIVRAARDMWLPYLPQKERWVSWYESTVDLHESLEPSEFVGKAIERLPTLEHILKHNVKAFIANGNGRNGSAYKDIDQPFFTVTEAQKIVHRMWIKFKVVRSSARCLMRWQSFPDSYETVGTLGIGNAVPPLMYQKIIEQMTGEV